MQTYSYQEFNQFPNKIHQLAQQEPVIISNQGKPEQVLMSYTAYTKLINNNKPFKSIADALSGSAEVADIDFDPPRTDIGFRPVEF